MDAGRDIFDVDKEFFLITSDNLDAVETRLYGYCISDGNIITDSYLRASGGGH